MKKHLFFLFVLSALPFTLFAGNVTLEQALKTAKDFMGGKTFNTAVGYSRARGTSMSVSTEPFYVFNATEGGYVIVSGVDCTREILGYSQTGTLDLESLPANLQWWLDEYARQIDALGTSTIAVKPFRLSEVSAIPPLIHTKWSQREPYNYMCPDGSGKDYYEMEYNINNRCVTGCVATAMAQVMNYWQWPESCPALKPYITERTEKYTTIFLVKNLPSTTFKWNLMKDYYSYADTGDAADAVAELMRYCGQSVKMNYGTSGSPAYSNKLKEALVETFNYNPNIESIYRKNYNLDEWENIIYNELAGGRPVLYSGEDGDDGHAFVVDGYSSDGLFHVNLGWGGYQDDYFVLSVADPKQADIDGEVKTVEFIYNQHALIGVKPLQEYEMRRPYAVLSDDSLTVTFYYDNLMISRNSMAIGRNQRYTTATMAVFDESFVDYHPYFTDYWFHNCDKLKEIKGISNLNLDNVTDMRRMFYGCSSLMSLDLSGFKTDNVTDMSSMFYRCYSLTTIYVGQDWSTDKVEFSEDMFYQCNKLMGGEGTKYNYLYNDHAYARIDGGVEFPGYFTDISKADIHVVNTDGVSEKGSIYDVTGVKRETFIKGLNIIRKNACTTIKKMVVE